LVGGLGSRGLAAPAIFRRLCFLFSGRTRGGGRHKSGSPFNALVKLNIQIHLKDLSHTAVSRKSQKSSQERVLSKPIIPPGKGK
jgi:hypothetical protein